MQVEEGDVLAESLAALVHDACALAATTFCRAGINVEDQATATSARLSQAGQGSSKVKSR
ncbi:MAG: hypothetical protein ABL998_00580 [Planctomycetota bacterium]